MTLSEAAHDLYIWFNGHRWFECVGEGKDELIVYCKTKPPKLFTPPSEYEGFPVRVVVTGGISPLGVTT